MKPVPLPALLLAAAALAQAPQPYVFRGEGVTISGGGIGKANYGPVSTANLYGGVTLLSPRDGLRVTARTADGEFVTGRKKPANGLRRVVLVGDVVATQTKGTGTSSVRGSKMVYTSADGLRGEMRLLGPVSLTNADAKEGRSLQASGATGTLNLGPGPDGKTDLRAAVLAGAVRMRLDQEALPARAKAGDVAARAATAAARYDVRADKAVFEDTPTGDVIRLTGNVFLKGTGENTFDVPNVRAVTITRNEKGEASKVDVDNGPLPVTTTLKKGKA